MTSPLPVPVSFEFFPPNTPVGSEKLKTVVQLAAITLYILPLGAGADGLRLAVLVVAVVLTVATGLDYLMGTVRADRNPARDGS